MESSTLVHEEGAVVRTKVQGWKKDWKRCSNREIHNGLSEKMKVKIEE